MVERRAQILETGLAALGESLQEQRAVPSGVDSQADIRFDQRAKVCAVKGAPDRPVFVRTRCSAGQLTLVLT